MKSKITSKNKNLGKARQLLIIIYSLLITSVSLAQSRVFSSDIDNFWNAYDAISKTSDKAQKLQLINEIYIEKGTDGLRSFMKVRNYSDTLWVELIAKYPKFWNSVRANTFTIKSKEAEIEQAIANFRKLYPKLRPANLYFTVGGLRSGGTVDGDKVLIGTEIATADAKTDVSEFENDWLGNVFKKQSLDNVVFLNVHEYVHTQQKQGAETVLASCIQEGSCDFIAELATKKPLESFYLTYGKAHADEVKNRFRLEMFTDNTANWLYNGTQKGEASDLGYYVGYEICKRYYEKAKDKKKAVSEIIDLEYSDESKLLEFVQKSGYFKTPIVKSEIVKEYESLCPEIVSVGPFQNGEKSVSSNLTEYTITFSKPMNPKAYSMNYSEEFGKNGWPITEIIGFSNENKTVRIRMKLEPKTDYGFVITNRGFKSQDGFKLRNETYKILFKTN
ncbi:DUF2268 domain-containing putative Zn-dependent protease [Flavobacterium sp.]|uniref:DUF2268 domain-containing putative Zn-dependent protease n=1 Tax=Flavobacterium sp. TaxID=239 RepID=UPI0012258784|nr:DUF2268 domain-containing putative Zn-dependent protease [Flavobacterium sp.]RZJ68981.1 MAG: hypothetical protein EOO49_18955 [Flavobacterium sp.]